MRAAFPKKHIAALSVVKLAKRWRGERTSDRHDHRDRPSDSDRSSHRDGDIQGAHSTYSEYGFVARLSGGSVGPFGSSGRKPARFGESSQEFNPRHPYVDHIGRMPFKKTPDADNFSDGLRKAGLAE